MRKFLFVFLFFIVFQVFYSQAFANETYLSELDGVYPIRSKKITVWIEPSPYQNIVYEAIKEWAIASNNCISFYEEKSPYKAHVRIYFVDRLAGDSIGVTSFQDGYRKIMVEYTYKNSKIRKSNKDIYQVVLHEFGHALGLYGHSSDRNDVLYPNNNMIGIHTSRRDFNTIRSLYCR